MHAAAGDLPIVLDEVSVVLRGGTLLERVSLAINAGAPTVLIGPNGAGKTTLLRLLMGLIAPSQGRLTWGGRTRSPSRRCAIVFQRPVMLRRSAAANIRYVLAAAGLRRPARTQRCAELLALVGLTAFATRAARRLSAGEQQRLALARALAKNPDVLLLDEPTASLDPAATKAVEDVIRTITAHGIKVVMSTHDLGGARRLAGDVVLLHRGRVIEAGAAAGFFASPQTEEARRFLAGELLL